MTRPFEAKLLVLVVFSIGVATGVALTNLYESRVQSSDGGGRNPFAQERDAFFNFLNLSADQQAEVSKILEETRMEYHQLRDRTRPAYDEIRQRSRNRIRAILNDEQMRHYDEWLAAQRERHNKRKD